MAWHNMAGSESCGKGLDVEAGSGARALMHVQYGVGMAWCGCLTYLVNAVDALLLSTLSAWPVCLDQRAGVCQCIARAT
jgi:hypothetical protein